MPEMPAQQYQGVALLGAATLRDSQSARSAAISKLFFSIITMWPLPCTP